MHCVTVGVTVLLLRSFSLRHIRTRYDVDDDDDYQCY